MKHLLVLALVTFFGSQASAATKFSCSNVGGVEEWTIYVDLDKQKAGFFDNDNTAIVPLTSVRSLESNPPQMLYTFEGKDTGGGTGETLRISFNKTKLKASVTFNPGKPGESRKESPDGREEFPDLDLE